MHIQMVDYFFFFFFLFEVYEQPVGFWQALKVSLHWMVLPGFMPLVLPFCFIIN